MSLSFWELILDSKYPDNKVQISWYDMKGFPDYFVIHIYYILHFLTQIFYFQINHTMYTLWKFPQLSFCVDYYTSQIINLVNSYTTYKIVWLPL